MGGAFMYRIGHLGNFESVPDAVKYILEGRTDRLVLI